MSEKYSSVDSKKTMTKQPNKIANPNTIGRPKGSLNKRTLIREALQQTFEDGEKGFWLAVAAQAKGGDMVASSMIADRLYPKLKPQAEAVQLSEPLDGSPQDMAKGLLRMVSNGELSADTAKELITAIADMCRIGESAQGASHEPITMNVVRVGQRR